MIIPSSVTQEIRSTARPDRTALATTVGLLAVAVYLLCAIAVWLWPQGSLSFFSIFFHGINLAPIYDPSVGLGRMIVGAAATFVGAYAITAVGTTLYDRLSGRA